MLKRDLRSDGQPRSPEAQQRLVANLEAMVEAWAPEVATRITAEAVEETRKAERRAAIESVCDVLGIEMNAPRRAHLASLDVAALRDLLSAIKSTRTWPVG